MKEQEYYNVPIYIEKAIKKLEKKKSEATELVAQIRDYMESHNIPKNTPVEFLKYIPDEDIPENQMKLEF